MRFALQANHHLIRELVVALDADEISIAETWRRVGVAASEVGVRRPSYDLVRELARVERARRAAHAEVLRAAAGVVLALGSPYVVRIPQALERLELAQARERLVS